MLTEKEIRAVVEDCFGREPKNIDSYRDHATSLQALEWFIRKSAEFKAIQGKRNHRWPLKQIMVLKDQKIMFCPIGKNANSALRRLLVVVSDNPHRERILNRDVNLVLDTERTGLQLADYSMQEALEMIQDPGFYKFAILRDPIERVLSAYWEMFVIHRMRHGKRFHTSSVLVNMQKVRKWDIDPERGISFSEFVNYIVSQDPTGLDVHWRPQHLYLENIDYDEFFMMNQLGLVEKRLKELTGREAVLEKINVTRGRKGVVIEEAEKMLPSALEKFDDVSRESFLNDRIQSQLESYYEKDFSIINSIPAKAEEEADSRVGANRDIARMANEMFFFGRPNQVNRKVVRMAYKMILGRDPENERVVSEYSQMPTIEALAEDLILSEEFQERYEKLRPSKSFQEK